MRRSTESDIDAFYALCERMRGFEGMRPPAALDGFLTALAVGPVWLAPARWLPLCFDDAFERCFADPEDHAQALAVLNNRLAVIRSELDAEALMDDPDQLRLDPLLDIWTPEEVAEAAKIPDITAEDVARLQTGAAWAEGFLTGLEPLIDAWGLPPGEAVTEMLDDLLGPVAALLMVPGSKDLDEFAEAYHRGKLPDREQMVSDALYAAQDLRVALLEFAPRPETRHVEKTPGRNDPCPCGGGKKYKKCHGAT